LFRHLYLDEDFIAEIESEIAISCNFHLDLFIFSNHIRRLEDALIKLLSQGKTLDLIVYAEDARKTIEFSQMLMRLVSQGGEVTLISNHENRYVEFAVMDKVYLLGGKEYEAEELPENALQNARRKFKEFKKKGKALKISRDIIDITFKVEKEFVRKGEDVKIYWNVSGADSIHINPWIGYTEPVGSIGIKIEEDTVFKITASNAHEKITKSLFIKIIPGQSIDFEVSVFEEEINEYLPIYSPAEFPGSYAVNRGQRIKIKWNAGTHGRLFSTQLGKLNLQDTHEMEVYDDLQVEFDYRNIFHQAHFVLKFFILEKYIETDEKMDMHLIHLLWKAILSIIVKRA
jgi:hypothetical protein